MPSVQLWLELGQSPESRHPVHVVRVWMELDHKTRDELVSRLAGLMTRALEKKESHDE